MDIPTAHRGGDLCRCGVLTLLPRSGNLVHMNTATATKSFQVGDTYQARSACDHNCVWTFTVTARTAKFVTLTDEHGRTVRVGVRNWDGIEYCSPLGTFSMAPSLAADRPNA